jgi:CRISPR type I-A-associated protein Csa5
MASKGIPEEVKEVAKFLGFFTEARIYGPVDKLAKPFIYNDVVSALNDALRQAKVLIESAREENVGGRTLKIVEASRGRELKAPYIPKSEDLEKFLELCSEDLKYAREAALLSFTYAYFYRVASTKEGGEL